MIIDCVFVFHGETVAVFFLTLFSKTKDHSGGELKRQAPNLKHPILKEPISRNSIKYEKRRPHSIPPRNCITDTSRFFRVPFAE